MPDQDLLQYIPYCTDIYLGKDWYYHYHSGFALCLFKYALIFPRKNIYPKNPKVEITAQILDL